MANLQQPNRRQVLRGLLGLGALDRLGIPKAGMAQSSFVRVSEQDVFTLFDDVLVDKFNAWKNRRDFNTEDHLFQKCQAAKNDKQLALILAFDAMSGVQHVLNLASQKFSVWGASEDADRDYDPIPLRNSPQYTSTAISEAAKADAMNSRGTFNTKVSFAQEVAASANSFLEDLKRDKLNFRQYVIERLMPDDPKDNQADLAVRAAAIRLGLNKPAI